MRYKVNRDFLDTVSGKNYKAGDIFDGEVYPALLNANNQYHEAFISEEQNLSEYTLNELKKLAKDKGVEGYSEMKKAELVEAVQNGND